MGLKAALRGGNYICASNSGRGIVKRVIIKNMWKLCKEHDAEREKCFEKVIHTFVVIK